MCNATRLITLCVSFSFVVAKGKSSEHRTACFRTGGPTSFSDASHCFCLTLPKGNI